MRVLIINVVCGVGSTGRICADAAEELVRQGHEVRIAYGRKSVPGQYAEYAVRVGSRVGVCVHALRARFFDASGFGSRGATRRLVAWIKEYDPDEIWLHNLHGYYINIEILFAYLRTCGKKVVWTLHDCWTFTGHCAHFSVSGCEKWKTRCCRPCPEKRSYPAALLLSACRRNYEKKRRLFCGIPKLSLIVPSAWLAGVVSESFLREYSVTVRHTAIDKTVFRSTEGSFRETHHLQGKRLILGVASTWTKRKGWDDFLRLAGMLDESFRIVLVGVTEKQKKMLPDNVLGVTRTNDKGELAALYTTADFFVNLTYEDTYPTVNLEAEACGTSVITYDVGGCRETVGRKDSVLVPTGDLRAVRAAIEAGDRE